MQSAISLEQHKGVEGSCEQLCSSDVHSLPLLKQVQETKRAHMTCPLQDATSCRISYRIPRQARYFSNTVWCLTVRSVTVWKVLRDNIGEREGNGTDRFIQQRRTVPSHTSLKRKKKNQANRHTADRHKFYNTYSFCSLLSVTCSTVMNFS